ncbi:PfkB family carbohydrate kinase [Streptomyces sp. ISL-100]|uniref:carbohydrate kinase family protein n=1 Tax=Streptomyces sp. ISL-100 TaxID=2819173 RepID=UPI001BEA11B9|nr:PfkB family carbohydrate kinase [Streptomyces sp. ISL-100]MBT2395373.1 hypothetical protein [Streptomyces sp. ISL-100]
MHRAVVAGHVCVDLIPRLTRVADIPPGSLVEIGPLSIRAGGCVSNTGGDLAALGAPVRLVADGGDDDLGAVLADLLGRSGAEVSFARVPGATTSYSVVIQPPSTDRTFWHHVGANAGFDGRRVDLTSADLLHVGYPPILPAILADHARPLCRLLADAHERGLTTSVDLAVVDPEAPAAGHDWERIFREALPLIDVFTPSVDDVSSALGITVDRTPSGLAATAGRLVTAGAAVVALGAGADGLVLRTASAGRLARGGRVLASLGPSWADRELWVPALPVKVVQTTGAGDAATAGLLYGLLNAMSTEDTLLLAARAAALKVGGLRTLPAHGPAGDPAEPYRLDAPGTSAPGWRSGQRGVLAGALDRGHWADLPDSV